MRIHIIAVIISLLALSGCSDRSAQAVSPGSYYTCPMHPTVISNAPGACPVCNMSLIRVETTEPDSLSREQNTVLIDARRQELAGISIDTVRYRKLGSAWNVVGTVAADDDRVTTVSSRAPGRIDKLFVKSVGQHIQKGAPLYSIYSEELLANKKEYLRLYGRVKAGDESFAKLMEAARNKLLLQGLTAAQIAAMESTGKVDPLITFFSPASGFVTAVSVAEGAYVEEGQSLFRFASLDRVWVQAEVYANETAAAATPREFLVEGRDRSFKGELVLNNPLIAADRRVQLLTIAVDNSEGLLIPGMMVNVRALADSSRAVLAVPRSAVLLEKMKTAWVRVDETRFAQRMLETGAGDGSWIEIVSGLKEGDLVVTHGAYLISSEFILKNGGTQAHEH